MPGVPDSAKRPSRTAEHPGLDRGQRRRRALVSRQRLARPAPAIDRDAAASSRGRTAPPQPDRGRDPDQWRNRRRRRPVVDARGLALHALCASTGACDSQIQQHLQCARRKEREAAADRGGQGVRTRPARRVAVRHRGSPLRGSRQGRVVSRRQGASGGRRRRGRYARACGYWTSRAANISISWPPARG